MTVALLAGLLIAYAPTEPTIVMSAKALTIEQCMQLVESPERESYLAEEVEGTTILIEQRLVFTDVAKALDLVIARCKGKALPLALDAATMEPDERRSLERLLLASPYGKGMAAVAARPDLKVGVKPTMTLRLTSGGKTETITLMLTDGPSLTQSDMAPKSADKAPVEVATTREDKQINMTFLSLKEPEMEPILGAFALRELDRLRAQHREKQLSAVQDILRDMMRRVTSKEAWDFKSGTDFGSLDPATQSMIEKAFPRTSGRSDATRIGAYLQGCKVEGMEMGLLLTIARPEGQRPSWSSFSLSTVRPWSKQP